MDARGGSSDPREILRDFKGSKRARIVVKHILDHGSVTTEELRKIYHYDHPPRAIRDVIDCGVPLIKTMEVSTDGRRFARYRFGDLTTMREGLTGRRAFPKKFKLRLVEHHGEKCHICNAKLNARYLQIDHRVPYEIAGEIKEELLVTDFMLVCGSCNRAKSWSCEHCGNWLKIRDPAICSGCYWAHPEAYIHIAMIDSRRLDLVWSGKEVASFDRIQAAAKKFKTPIPEYVKAVLLTISRKKTS